MTHARRNAVLAAIILTPLVMPLLTFAAPKDHKESASDPNVVRLAPIKWSGFTSGSTQPAAQTRAQSFSAAAAQPATSLGPNLVPNPSLETAGSNGLPANWHKGGYGANTRTLSYPVAGSGGAATKAVQVSVSGYSSGDAKWYVDEIPVTSGKTYQFSDAYTSDVSSIAELRVSLSDGTYKYIDIAAPGPSANFSTISGNFVAPANSVSVTIFHVIKGNGTLVTDDYSLREVTQAQSSNLLLNGDFETANGSVPAHWAKGGYGSNTRAFSYPAAGENGNGAKITLSGYTSGDAKWASDPVKLASGSYVYADSYEASVPTILTAEFARADGSLFYSDLKTLPASASWAHASANFTMPADAVSARVFHIIKQNGTLAIDNASIAAASSASGGIFSTGAVTFRFDDGLNNQYSSAAPILESDGFKGTFYIITHQIYDNGYTGYMSKAQVQDLASRGHEIGAHTQTHPHLTTLSAAQQQQEISGSRNDLLGWNVGPVLSFSYPFGEYDATTTSIVKNAGFSSAAATISGYVTSNSDHYQLEYQEVRASTTLATVKGWVDTAASTHTWLILTFHDVQDSPTSYGVTPATLHSIADYVKQKNIPVVTVTQGINSM